MVEKPIFLVGYMCSGKTTLGKALSKLLGVEFFDLDEFIEKRENRSISDIFAQEGESYFRTIEENSLDHIITLHAALPAIVALGGGTPCRPGVMEKLNAAGITAHLDVSVERLVERLELASQNRPLAVGKTKAELEELVITMLKERNPYYRKAHIRFDASRLETEEQIIASAREFAKLIQ